MDIKNFITEPNHSREYQHAVAWLDSKIGGEDEDIQIAWVGSLKDWEVLEEKYGEELFKYSKESQVDYNMFTLMLFSLMVFVYNISRL